MIFLYNLTNKLKNILIYAIPFSIAINLFWKPGNVYSGGIIGISQILFTIISKYFNFYISLSIIYYFINILLLIIAWFKYEKKIIFFAILSVTIASLIIYIIPTIELIKDPIICSIFGGALNGFSLGFALKKGLFTGGMDVIIAHIKNLTGKSTGKISIFLNGLIVLTTGFLFNWTYSFYSLLSIIISGIVTDLIYIKHQKIQVFIIIKKNNNNILKNLKLTFKNREFIIISNVIKSNLKEKKKYNFIITIITQYEISILKKIIQREDKNAFISISKNIEVLSYFKELNII